LEDGIDKLLGELMEARALGAPPLEHDSTRGRIATAALELFAERSYESATTKAIAGRAGVTERTLFKHFPSKETLFAKTVFPALLEFLQPFALRPFKLVLADHHGDFRATLTALVSERVSFATRHPALVSMLARELLLRPAFRQALQGVFAAQVRPQLFAVLDQARASGQLGPTPNEVVVRMLIGQVGAYVASRTLFAPDAPHDDAAEVGRIVSALLDGLAPGP
jgi:AcrR family transcriptional regulator